MPCYVATIDYVESLDGRRRRHTFHTITFADSDLEAECEAIDELHLLQRLSDVAWIPDVKGVRVRCVDGDRPRRSRPPERAGATDCYGSRHVVAGLPSGPETRFRRER